MSAWRTVRSPEVTAAARRVARSTRYSWRRSLRRRFRSSSARPFSAQRSPPGIRSRPSTASLDAAPPALGASQIFGCAVSGTELTNAIVWPSGDQRGELSPARVIGDLRQRPAVGVDDPDVGVHGSRRMPCRCGRRRTRSSGCRATTADRVVPVVAGGQLCRAARRGIDHPQVRALVVEPAAVVELVAGVLVVPHIARRLRRVARPAAADDHDGWRRLATTGSWTRRSDRLVSRRGSPPPSGSSHTCVRGVSVAASPAPRPRRQERDRLPVRAPPRAVRRLHRRRQRHAAAREPSAGTDQSALCRRFCF